MPTVKTATLVLDFSLYPRGEIDDANLARIAEARRAGVRLPPPVVDRKSKRVVDGFHRVRAALREDPDGEIEVEWRTYADDAALFRDAVRLNAAHGKPLSPFDQARCLTIAAQLHIGHSLLAGDLGMSVERLGRIGLRKTANAPDGTLIPIKGTLAPYAGTQLTGLQVLGNEHAGGMSALFYINQVINLIENDIFDRDNPRVVAALDRLVDLLARQRVTT